MRWVAAAAVLLPLLAACGEDDPRWGGLEYVALGDSSTVAPGTGADDGEACFQSERNYPRLVADRLDLDLTDMSCGGARTQHLTEEQPPFGNPPQLDALSADTALVTMRIGANDASLFAHSVINCGKVADRDPDGSPCAEEFGADYFDDAVADTREALDEALAEIARRAPEARVVVLGYPEWAPPEAPEDCDQLDLARGDYAYARRANELIVETVAAAAAAAEVDYVDEWAATEGHHMCAEEPWIAGASPNGRAAPFHPYRREQLVAADLLVALLDERGPLGP
ncbi:SGNH/GDSL hydrolase family protein [Nocardioides panacisoli]|uniref:SGNH/GDSL hydrolase family protein n=1 Tax=Nocardioides panacisoli TaxID=627624 RepID=UPI001C628E12|nr:SGNH/GDSL hydrolase family protein [Nocardioides panacisoli]QYJ02945.1 SGNH/GDSL hydrolase family protein [Nocardioides panacisoli]